MIRAYAALLGLLAVGVGAFGAHAIADPQAKEWIATGSQYALPHAVAILWASDRYRWSAALWAAGALLFAGSLWGLALGLPRPLAMAAPAGGVLMIGGWLLLLLRLILKR